MTLNIGQRAGSTIIPISAITKRTAQYDLTVTAANFTSARAVAIAYADSVGKWRMAFNLQGSITGTPTLITLAVTDVVFKSGFYQACSIVVETGGTYLAWDALTSSNTGDIVCNAVSGGATFVVVSGDVELESEPTWAAANMEGVANVALYVPSAAAGIQGLVDNRVANTLGTPILGKTDGVAVAAGYVGQRITWASPPSSQTGYANNSYADWTNANIVLTAGIWAVYANICASIDTTGSDGMTIQILDATNSNTLVPGMRKDIVVVPGIGNLFIPFVFETKITSSTTYKIQACLRHYSGTTTSNGTFNEDRAFSEFYAIRTG